MPSYSYTRRRRISKPARRASEGLAVNVIEVRSKAPVGKAKDKFKYALRCPKGQFWDGKTVPSGTSKWNVKFLQMPRFWNSKKLAANAWKKYEIERLHGAELPDLMMVEFEFKPVETASIPETDVKPSFSEIMSARTKRYCDSTMSVLIDRMVKKCGGDPVKALEYRYAIKRKAGTKTIMDKKFPQSISNLNYTLFNRENDAVMARLILGGQMVGYYDLAPFLDHTTQCKSFVQNQMGK